MVAARSRGWPAGLKTILFVVHKLTCNRSPNRANVVVYRSGTKKETTMKTKTTTTKKNTAKAVTKTSPKTAAAPKAKADGPRAASKQAELIGMLKRPNGAGLAEIMKKFGWQQHTTRAIMSQGGSPRHQL
jgi:hypothetical protein